MRQLISRRGGQGPVGEVVVQVGVAKAFRQTPAYRNSGLGGGIRRGGEFGSKNCRGRWCRRFINKACRGRRFINKTCRSRYCRRSKNCGGRRCRKWCKSSRKVRKTKDRFSFTRTLYGHRYDVLPQH